MIGVVWWGGAVAGTDRTKAVSAQLAELAVQNVARNLEEFDRILLAIIARHQSFELQNMDAQDRNTPYVDILRTEPYFAFADILDKNGQEVAGWPRTNQSWSSRDYFAALEHSPSDIAFVGARFSINDEQAVGFTLSRKITDRNGNFSGVAVLGIRLAYFVEQLSRLNLHPNDTVMLLRDDGLIMLRLPPSREIGLGNQLGPLTPLYTALRGGLAAVTAIDPVDHVERQFAFHRVGDFHLVLSLGTVRSDMPLERWYPWVLLSAGAMIATGVGLRWQRSKRGTSTGGTG